MGSYIRLCSPVYRCSYKVIFTLVFMKGRDHEGKGVHPGPRKVRSCIWEKFPEWHLWGDWGLGTTIYVSLWVGSGESAVAQRLMGLGVQTRPCPRALVPVGLLGPLPSHLGIQVSV